MRTKASPTRRDLGGKGSPASAAHKPRATTAADSMASTPVPRGAGAASNSGMGDGAVADVLRRQRLLEARISGAPSLEGFPAGACRGVMSTGGSTGDTVPLSVEATDDDRARPS